MKVLALSGGVHYFYRMMKDSFLNRKFRYTYSNATLYIILVNVLVFIATNYTNIAFRGLPLIYWLSLIPNLVNNYGWVWQFVTHMFVHGSFMHLLVNMYALLFFGPSLERRLGTREFILFYFLCGILGGVVGYAFYLLLGMGNVAVLGASGAVYALMFLCAVFFPNMQVLLLFIIPLKLPYAVLVFTAIEIVSQVFSLSNGVAHLFHLTGVFIAWLYVWIRFRLNPIKVWRDNL